MDEDIAKMGEDIAKMDEDIAKMVGEKDAKVIYVGTREWSWLIRKSKYYKNIDSIPTWKGIHVIRVVGYNHLGVSLW